MLSHHNVGLDRQRTLLPLLLSAAVGLLSACAVSQPQQETPVPRPTFSFTAPEACQPPGSGKVTFAIVAPQWVHQEAQTPDPLQTPVAQYLSDRQAMEVSFASAMRDGFMAMLTCKGFTTKGPFASYEEMVYPDRMGSDLVLVPQIEFNLAVQTEQVQQGFGAALAQAMTHSSQQTVQLQGSATLTGRVTLSLMESVTNTRMWEKTIEVQPQSFNFVGTRAYPIIGPGYEVLYQRMVTGDPGFLKEYAPRLQAIYQSALKTAWNYLDPQEMALVKRQSLEPRRRAVTTVGK